MNLKICPICRSLYPEDFTKCDRCNEELIDNEIYKKLNDNQRNKYMRKYKSKYDSKPSSVTIHRASMPIQPVLETNSLSQQQNIPKCPTCGSTNIKHISTLNRAVSIGMLGIFSGKIGKNYECLDCKARW